MRAIPAAFQNTELASSATPTKAPPMPAARAPMAIFRNWPSNVPTFSKISAAASPGRTTPRTASAARNLFTTRPPSAGLADDDEPAPLRAVVRVDREHVDPAHHVLAVARDQVPARLAIVGIVLLAIVSRIRRLSDLDRRPDRLVDGIGRVELLHQIARDRVDPDRPLVGRQPEEVDVRARRIRRVRGQVPGRRPLL